MKNIILISFVSIFLLLSSFFFYSNVFAIGNNDLQTLCHNPDGMYDFCSQAPQCGDYASDKWDDELPPNGNYPQRWLDKSTALWGQYGDLFTQVCWGFSYSTCQGYVPLCCYEMVRTGDPHMCNGYDPKYCLPKQCIEGSAGCGSGTKYYASRRCPSVNIDNLNPIPLSQRTQNDFLCNYLKTLSSAQKQYACNRYPYVCQACNTILTPTAPPGATATPTPTGPTPTGPTVTPTPTISGTPAEQFYAALKDIGIDVTKPTNKITISGVEEIDISFSPNNTIIIDRDTQISINSDTFVPANLTINSKDYTPPPVLPAPYQSLNPNVKEVYFGLPESYGNKYLLFSKPIQITMFLGSIHKGKQLTIFRTFLKSSTEYSDWTSDGITGSKTCIVTASGYCTFSATKSGRFAVAFDPTAPTLTPTSSSPISALSTVSDIKEEGFGLFIYLVASGVYIMIIHFAVGVRKQFDLFQMIGYFVIGAALGFMTGSFGFGFIAAMILSFLFW
jgi:hypothetical protein